MNDKYEYIEEQSKMLNQYAFPGRQMALIGNTEMEVATQGLTKREYFAVMAMQGLLAGQFTTKEWKYFNIGRSAVEIADELLKQLES